MGTAGCVYQFRGRGALAKETGGQWLCVVDGEGVCDGSTAFDIDYVMFSVFNHPKRKVLNSRLEIRI